MLNIPFTPDMRKAILEGKKVATSRGKRYGWVGNVFVVGDVSFKITNVRRRRIDDVAQNDYRAEGFSSPDEFISYYMMVKNKTRARFGKPPVEYNPDEIVYYHEFHRTTYRIDII